VKLVPTLADRGCCVVENIRNKIQDNFLWVSIKETQDCDERFIANIIVRSLNNNLIAVDQFETTNRAAVSEILSIPLIYYS
jgi:hypothetical protein